MTEQNANGQPRNLDEWRALNPLAIWRSGQQPVVSLESVGDHAGVTRTSVLYWEKGTFWPRPSCMQALADMMKVAMPDLHGQWATWMAVRPATKHAGVGMEKRLREATKHKVEKKQKKRAAKKAAPAL